MNIIFLGTTEPEYKSNAYNAIDLIDRMVWGGRMSLYIDTIKILRSGEGIIGQPNIFRGLRECYDPERRLSILNCAVLLNQGGDRASNFAWSIAHDLAHAFDVAHGNLIFNEHGTLTYLGREYAMREQAKLPVPEYFSNAFRESKYYAAHDYYEPWETRALFAADAVMSIMRNDQSKNPNLVAV